MGVLGVSWLFALLVGVSNGYPVQEAASKQALKAPKGQLAFAPPVEEVASSSSSQVSASPQSIPVENQQIAFNPVQQQEFAWALPPLYPFSQEIPQRPLPKVEPTEAAIIEAPAPEPIVSLYQAGDLVHSKRISEHGDYESETEEQGYAPAPPPPPFAPAQPQLTSEPKPHPPSAAFLGPYDYMFLTGQYPRGTITHFSSTFEQGQDHWRDSHYLKYDYPPVASPPEPSVLQKPQQQQKQVFHSIESVPKQGQAPAPQLRSFRHYYYPRSG